MEEKKVKKVKEVKWLVAGLLLIALIAGSIYVLGNKMPPGKSILLPDPETGIQNWIEAVNQKNIDRLYNLAPDEIKQQVTLVQFKEDNKNNTILQPGFSFINFSVIDKKQNVTYAQINAQIVLQKPSSQGILNPEDVPVEYRFALYYEHGEWKTWTF